MLRFPVRFLIPAVAAMGAADALADHRLVPEQGAIRVLLLRQPSVQADLKLSPETVAKIQTFSEGQWKKAQALSDAPDNVQAAKFDEMASENEKFIAENLTAEQQKRLNQIGMQVAGVMWIGHPDVAKELNLTDEQKAKFEELRKDARREMEDLLYSVKPEDRLKKFQEYREGVRARTGRILTDEQRDKWKQMRGEPFKGELD